MPGGDKAIRPEDGKQFSSEYQPKNRGRKPKVFSSIAADFKAQGIESATPERVREAYELLLALPLQDVLAIAGKPTDKENLYPALLRLVASEMLGRRKREMLDSMLDRAHGKPTQALKHEGMMQFQTVSASALSEKDEAALAALLQKLSPGNAGE